MCGRFTQKTPPAALAAAFGLASEPEDLGARYNVAPGQAVLVVPNLAGPRRAVVMRWGFVPAWARDGRPAAPLVNARAETAAQKPSFRDALRHRRGLLLMDGFYEWHSVGKQKRPVHFHLPGDQPFAVAALWSTWVPPAATAREGIDTVCLLTTTPHPLVAAVHDRMPLMLPPAAWAAWLDPAPQTPGPPLAGLLVPWQGPLLAAAVSPYVNDARHEGPGCLDPFPEALQLWP